MTDLLRMLLDSEEIIKTGGLLLVLLIVYLETGVLVCFFLPGDYLLFLSGVFAATGLLKIAPGWLVLLIFTAGVLGYYTGFLFGRSVGKTLYNRPDTRFFKKRYLLQTEAYFQKYGGNAIIIARFLPVVRTFMPVLAGIVRISPRTFHITNLTGAALWSSSMVLSGYYIGQSFPQIVDYIQYVIVGFISLSSATVIWQWWQMRKQVATPAEKIPESDKMPG